MYHKEVLLMIFITFNSCISQDKKTVENQIDDERIMYVEFQQNPAMEYYPTKKYRLTRNALFFVEGDKLKEMGKEDFLLAKVLIDSLPKGVIKKNILGHTTVEMDIPDWTLEIYLKSKDTVYLASGGLPVYMKKYNQMVWKVVSKLDGSD